MKLPIFSKLIWKYARWHKKATGHRFGYEPGDHYLGMGLKKRRGYVVAKNKITH